MSNPVIFSKHCAGCGHMLREHRKDVSFGTNNHFDVSTPCTHRSITMSKEEFGELVGGEYIQSDHLSRLPCNCPEYWESRSD